MENIVITFDSDTTAKFQQTMDLLEKLGQVDKATADAFKATNNEFKERLGLVDKNKTSMDALAKAGQDVTKNLALGAGQETLKKLGDETEKVIGKTQRLTTQLRAMKQELALMEQAGQGGSKAFIDLAVKAAQLEDQIGDTAARVRGLASDTKNIDAVVGVVSGLASAFSVAQGAAALLGSENQDLQKALLKVQAAMAIANGVQQISNLLQKESAVVLGFQRIQLALTAAATGLMTGATSLATIATAAWNRVLALNPIVAITTAITLAVAAIYQFVNATDDSEESVKNLNEQLKAEKKAIEEVDAAFKKTLENSNQVIDDGNQKILNNIETAIQLAKIRGAGLSEVFNLEAKLIDARLTLLKNSGNADTAQYTALLNDKLLLTAQYYRDLQEAKRKSEQDLKKLEEDTSIVGIPGNVSQIPEVVTAQATERFKTNLAKQGAEARKKIREEESAEQVEIDKQLQEQILQTSIQLGNQLFEFGAAINARKQANLEQQLKSGAISEAKYAREVAELKRKQAIADKEAAAFNIIINTAIALSKVASQTGVLAPVLGAIIAALGAAQLATVLAQPIPKFAKGTKRAPAGMKLVGEEGPELINDRGGYEIIPADKTRRILNDPFSFPELIPNVPDEVLRNAMASKMPAAIDYDKLGRSMAKHMAGEIAKHPKVSMKIDENGFQISVQEGILRKNYLDKKHSWNG